MENKVKIWGKEVERCFICTYYNGYEGCCNITGEYIDPISNDNINNKCPFLKPITKEVIEGFGFKYDNDSETFKLHKEYEMYELELANTIINIEHFYQTKLIAKQLPFENWKSFNIFNGEISNPIELEFILKSIGVIE